MNHLKCDVCQEIFSEKSMLLEHLQIHSDKKPLLCDVCGKAFTEGKNYAFHVDSHSEKKGLKFHVCYKYFPRRVFYLNIFKFIQIKSHSYIFVKTFYGRKRL